MVARVVRVHEVGGSIPLAPTLVCKLPYARLKGMKKFFFLLTFLTVIFVLPLGHDLRRYNFSSSLSWNDSGWLLGIWIIFFLGTFIVQKKFHSQGFKSFTPLLLTFFLFLHVGIHGVFFSQFADWVRYLLFIWFVFTFSYLKKLLPSLVWGLLLVGVVCLQAQWGIVQFITQSDLGFQILGEPQLGISIPGVAKFSVEGIKFIRAYGLYAHSNVFAANLLASLFVCLYLGVHVSRKHTSESSALYRYLLSVGYILFVALLLTFSRSAYLGLLLLILLWFFYLLQKQQLTTALKHSYKFVGIIVVTLFIFTPFFLGRISDSEDRGFVDRQRGFTFAQGLIQEAPFSEKILGIGIGNYENSLKGYLSSHSTEYMPWEIAPFHNAVALLLMEIGLIGGVILLAFLVWGILKYRHWMFYLSLALPLLPLLLFDHYFVTQTTPFVIWSLAAFICLPFSQQLFLVDPNGKQGR